MQKKIMSWLLWLFVLVARTCSLNCSCDSHTCQDISTCIHGIAEDYPCFCCEAVCALAPGEVCGGPEGLRGPCGDGYYCAGLARSGASIAEYQRSVAHCIKGAEMVQYGFSPLFSSLLPFPSPSSTPAKEVKCRTTCNLEFCNEGWRTNKYCSANETAFMRVPEREPCQHTSCSACRFILEPDCPTCPVPVKKRCLRHFELCVERHNARDDIIIKLTDPRVMNSTGTIICHVPPFEEANDDDDNDD